MQVAVPWCPNMMPVWEKQGITWTEYALELIEETGNELGYYLEITSTGRSWEEQVDAMADNYINKGASSLHMYDRNNRTYIKPSFIIYMNGQITKWEFIEILKNSP